MRYVTTLMFCLLTTILLHSQEVEYTVITNAVNDYNLVMSEVMSNGNIKSLTIPNLDSTELRARIYSKKESLSQLAAQVRHDDFYRRREGNKALAALDAVGLNNYQQYQIDNLDEFYSGSWRLRNTNGLNVLLSPELRDGNTTLFRNAQDTTVTIFDLLPESLDLVTIRFAPAFGADQFEMFGKSGQLYIGENDTGVVFWLRRLD